MNKSSIHFICVITSCLSLVIIIVVVLVAHRVPALEEGMATTPVFLPGESHGQRSLEGAIQWVTKSRT